jgi:uncharacterized protein (DUF924 family)
MSDSQIQAVLDFWFQPRELNEPNIDSRMACWFGAEPEFDAGLSELCFELAEEALLGDLDHWADSPHGILALILLLEQIPRHIHKLDEKALRGDHKALKLCEKGVATDAYRKLNSIQQMFFFMPLQRAESMKVQRTSVKIFNSLAERVSVTMRDTFETVAQFAELRHDIIAKFGRFPHRNSTLGRSNTPEEDAFLSA